jgi:outer membrane cobalamin receptor
VRVLGNERVVGLRRHDEFETRRINHQATVSITRDDIEKRHPTSVWQMLEGIPSIRVVDLDTSVVVMSTRVMVQSIVNQGYCYLAVMVDGILKADANGTIDLRSLPTPDEVHGIEVFAGASSIPVQYGGVGVGKWCGLVAVWTR